MSDSCNFIPQHPLRTAVLFIIFNRLDTTKLVFDEIRKAKPPRLYVSADGPREDHPGEDKKVHTVRNYVMNSVDWDCEIKTLFSEKNIGCKYGPIAAINWFFENEESGIILEDDCVPSQSFFWFCEDLLYRYRYDKRIMLISGLNIQGTWNCEDYDYFFSNLGGIGDWASWKRAWKLNDPSMKNLDLCIKKNYLRYLLGDQLGKIREQQMINVIQNDLDAWDYQWGFTRHINSGMACVPSKNLYKHIGFGADATHTKIDDGNSIESYEMNFPLRHNHIIIPDREYDRLFFPTPFMNKKFVYKVSSILKKLIKI